jgi:uroporphyrinogen decarboxylase
MRLTDVLDGRKPDRIPFVPAVLEHKAWFVRSVPGRVCRDADLLVQATLREFEDLQADALVVGLDPYNVEAEAAGARVHYPDGDDPGIPSLVPGGEVLAEGAQVSDLRVPDPEVDGRMPLFLHAAERVERAIGRQTVVRGALSGPFSMAAGVMGAENLLMAVRSEPDVVRELMGFCVGVLAAYARAFARRGCGVVIYDSHASPEIISPATYRALALEPARQLIEVLHREGVKHVPLIIGGNTLPILDAYLETGANNILCDFRTPLAPFLDHCRRAGRAFRRSLDPTGFLTDLPEEVHRRAVAEVAAAEGYPGFILGTGVVPLGTPTEVLLAAKEAVTGN